MKIETLRDVLEWTRNIHHYLSECLTHCSENDLRERGKLLLNYLADHEQQLKNTIDRVVSDSDIKALNTWCYEYFQKNQVITHKHCDKPYANMTPEEVMQEVTSLHNQIIDVYRQLSDQFESPSAMVLINEMLALEQHEAMRLVQGSNRLTDV